VGEGAGAAKTPVERQGDPADESVTNPDFMQTPTPLIPRLRTPDAAADRPPSVLAPSELVALPRRSPLAAPLAAALEAADGLHVVRAPVREVPVRLTRTTSEAGAYRYSGREPVDVRVSRLCSHPGFTLLHELAHLIDHQSLALVEGRDSGTHPALDEFRRAARETASFTARRRSWSSYYARPRECFARAYAQWVATRSGCEPLVDALRAAQAGRLPHVWPADSFVLLGGALERAFAEIGWVDAALLAA
jgi:hypothetical protein